MGKARENIEKLRDGDKGDIVITGPAYTLDPNAIPGAVSPANTLRGNNTGSTGATLNLTPGEVATLLPTFGISAKGLVPASGGGTTNFLRADGMFAAPPGGSGGTGDVVGPASSTANAVAVFSDTTGKLLADSAKLLPAGAVVGTTDTQTLSAKTLTSPTINGGTATALTGLAIRNAGTGAFDMTVAYNGTLTAGRALTWNLNDVARTISLAGNITTAGALTTAGAFALTLTTTAATNVTFPTTGTLATLAGTETFTNKTLTNPTITTGTVDTFPIGYRNVPQNSQSVAYTLVLTDAGRHILHPSADTTARTFTIPANASVAFPIGTAITFVNQNAAGVVTIAITTDTMRLAGAGTTGSRTLAANGIATALKVTATEWIISGTGLT